jgi:hypothetical protein
VVTAREVVVLVLVVVVVRMQRARAEDAQCGPRTDCERQKELTGAGGFAAVRNERPDELDFFTPQLGSAVPHTLWVGSYCK